jgi:hypothetical protein
MQQYRPVIGQVLGEHHPRPLEADRDLGHTRVPIASIAKTTRAPSTSR